MRCNWLLPVCTKHPVRPQHTPCTHTQTHLCLHFVYCCMPARAVVTPAVCICVLMQARSELAVPHGASIATMQQPGMGAPLQLAARSLQVSVYMQQTAASAHPGHVAQLIACDRTHGPASCVFVLMVACMREWC